jgi:putative transcriptional regulator
MRCLLCKNGELVCSKEKYHYTESGLDNVYLENIEVCRCPACHEKIVSIPAMPELNRLIGLILIKKKSPLNGKEIRYLRKNIGQKANELAELMGVDVSTFSRWESGKQKMSKPHDRFFRLLYSNIKGISEEEIRHLIKWFKEIEEKEETPLWQIPLSTWCKAPLCTT